MSSSKRPIIMTVTTSSSSAADYSINVLREKIRGRFDVVECHRPKVDIACAYLWIVCLTAGCYLSFTGLKEFLEQQDRSLHGHIDLRAALLQLELLLKNHPQRRKLSFSQLDIKENGNLETETKDTTNKTVLETTVSEIEPIELPRTVSPRGFSLAKKPRFVYNVKTNTVEMTEIPKRSFARIRLDDSLYEADSDDQSEKNSEEKETEDNKDKTSDSRNMDNSTSAEILEHVSWVLERLLYSDILSASCCTVDPDFLPTTNRVFGVVDALPDLTVPLSWNEADTQKEIQRTLRDSSLRILAKEEEYRFQEPSGENSSLSGDFVPLSGDFVPLSGDNRSLPGDFVPLSVHLRHRVRATEYDPAVRFHCRSELEHFVEKQKRKRNSRNMNSSQLMIRPFDVFLDLDSLVAIANKF